MKLSWISTFGPEATLTAALERLEVIGDTFLSVSAPVQYALPAWLGQRQLLQQQIRSRVSENLACLDQFLAGNTFINRLEIQGGWAAILRVPAVSGGEEAALKLLNLHGAVVHPGSFFGLPEAGWFVISLLPTSENFCAGCKKLLEGIYQLMG
jgi:aspartate/methionine/tyrosine aminotransferase